MKMATEDPVEYKKCQIAFEKHEHRFYQSMLNKRRKAVLGPGEARYLDTSVNMRWMAWRACWDWLRS